MKTAYYPGCTLKTTAKEYDISTTAVAKTLGIELVEPSRWNCCGTVHALARDDVMHHLAPVRNLLRVEQMKDAGEVGENKVVTICAMCFNTLKRSNSIFNTDSERARKINENFENESAKYTGKVEVLHFLELLREIGWDKIKEKVIHPLRGLKVAPYYGCLLLRPRGIGVDNADNPSVIEDLFKSLGAEVIDFAYKQKCCGSYNAVHMREVVADLSHKIIESARSEGANIISTACPLCEFNLGNRQSEVHKRHPDSESMPVVYFTQLMAAAFGLSDEERALRMNKPDPIPLLQKLELIK